MIDSFLLFILELLGPWLYLCVLVLLTVVSVIFIYRVCNALASRYEYKCNHSRYRRSNRFNGLYRCGKCAKLLCKDNITGKMKEAK